MTSDWHKAQSFATRFATITQIGEAYVRAHPDSADSSAIVRQLEGNAFREAISDEEYQSRIGQILQQLSSQTNSVEKSTTPSISADSVAEDVLVKCQNYKRLGRYQTAAAFMNGLFSTVFVAKKQIVAPNTSGTRNESNEDSASQFVALKATILAAVRPPHDAAREARIMKRAAGASIMPILEYFYDGSGHLVLVMPFMPCTLQQLLGIEHSRRQQNKSGQSMYTVPQNLKRALLDLFRALAHIHKSGIIHRDVKPSNILLSSPNGPAYLSDFGIAWCVSDGASEPERQKISDVGTTCYRAPEILFGDTAYGSTLDIWAAGCVVAETLLAGSRTLFDAGDAGSELTLIMNIFESLGTPNSESWPELSRLPDWGKMHFKDFPAKTWKQLLPRSEHAGIQLVEHLVRFSESARWTAEYATSHDFFHQVEVSSPS